MNTDADAWAELEDDTLGDRLKDSLMAMVTAHEHADHRSAQDRAGILGPSQIGSPCTRCLARHVLGRPVQRSFDDPWCRIIGTAVHAYLAAAAERINASRADNLARPAYLVERRVRPDDELLPKGGNLDLYDHTLRTVVDHKVVGRDRLKHYKANGPSPVYRMQSHLYGRGLEVAGFDVQHVAVAFWHRGGHLRDLYVWTEPYDPAIAAQALERFRTIRDLALSVGPSILPNLPADPDCWDCEGRDVTPGELS